jgi:hypothetical protein
MGSPASPKIETDPNLAADQERAQKALVDSLQNQAQLDTANIMARYGTKLALSNSGVAAPMAGVA